LGDSDPHYFAWLTGALTRFERHSGELAAMGAGGPVEFWVLAGARTNRAVEFVRDQLGRARTAVRFLDRFERGEGVTPVDLNALGELPDDACDVLMMTRASYMIEDPSAFLRDARRMLRPDGLLLIDWVHGAAEKAVLDLPDAHAYGGRVYPFLTTYCDPESVAEFAAEFGALVRHADQRSLCRRVWTRLGRGRAIEAEAARYVDVLRTGLAAAGKHLIDAEAIAPTFKVLFRDARYLRRLTKKHYLYLLTVLRPVGK
jgi:SAM-dependent methyltransferase